MWLCCYEFLAAASRLSLGYRSEWGVCYFGSEWGTDFCTFQWVIPLSGRPYPSSFILALRLLAGDTPGLWAASRPTPPLPLVPSVAPAPTLFFMIPSNSSKSPASLSLVPKNTIVFLCLFLCASLSSLPVAKQLGWDQLYSNIAALARFQCLCWRVASHWPWCTIAVLF
jgi:hypothetical protein